MPPRAKTTGDAAAALRRGRGVPQCGLRITRGAEGCAKLLVELLVVEQSVRRAFRLRGTLVRRASVLDRVANLVAQPGHRLGIGAGIFLSVDLAMCVRMLMWVQR